MSGAAGGGEAGRGGATGAGGSTNGRGGAAGTLSGTAGDTGVGGTTGAGATGGAAGAAGGGGTTGSAGSGGAAGGGGTTGSAGSGGAAGGSTGGAGVGGAAGSTGAAGVAGTTGGGGAGGSSPACTRIDCANPACVDDVCVAGPPAGWVGPIALYEGAPATLPTCSDPFSSVVFSLNATVRQDLATCSACSCNLQTSLAGCAVPTSVYTAASCGGTGSSAFVVASYFQGCQNGHAGGASASYGAPYVSAACNPAVKTPTATKPAIVWTKVARGCALPFPGVNGCSSGSICAPIPKTPYNGKLCIYQSGDSACPAGIYSTKHLYYTSATDGRGCSDCSCAAATGTCSINITGYSDANCASPAYSTTANSCSNGTVGSWQATMTGMNASCPVQGGAPNGTITPTGSSTVCCTP